MTLKLILDPKEVLKFLGFQAPPGVHSFMKKKIEGHTKNLLKTITQVSDVAHRPNFHTFYCAITF